MVIKKSLFISAFFIALVLILFPLTSLCLNSPPRSNSFSFDELGIKVNIPTEGYYIITEDTDPSHPIFSNYFYTYDSLMAHIKRTGFNHVIVDKDFLGEIYVSAVSYDYYDYRTLSDSEFEEVYQNYRQNAMEYGIDFNEYSIYEAENATYLMVSGHIDYGEGEYQNVIELSTQVGAAVVNLMYYKNVNLPLSQIDYDLVETIANNVDFSQVIETPLQSPDQLLDSLDESSAVGDLGDSISDAFDNNFGDSFGDVTDVVDVSSDQIISITTVVITVIALLLLIFLIYLFVVVVILK